MNLFFLCFVLFLCLNLIWLFWANFLLNNETKVYIPQVSPTTKYKGVSVLVAARNEAENLKTLIPAVFEQEYPEFELIVCDDRSTDGTKKLLDAFRKEYPRLNTVRVDKVPEGVNPKKNALLKAIEKASYDSLLLTDADCKPVSKKWVSCMAAPFEQGKQLILGYSPYERLPGLLNFFIRFETLHTAMQYFVFALSGLPYMGVGRNIAYTKTLFKQYAFKGDLNVTGGDDDLLVQALANNYNTACAMQPEAQALSVPEKTWKAWFRQKTRHLSVGKRYKRLHKLLLGCIFFSQAFSWIGATILLVNNYNFASVLVLFLFRMIIFGYILSKTARFVGHKTKVWEPACFEVLYLAYFIIIGISGSIVRRINWK